MELAEHDLINAHHTLLLGRECPYDTVCFHAQQCVEKYLKALLTYRSIPFPKIHDLSEIAHLLPAGLLGDLTDLGLEELTPYAVETRYAGFRENFTREEALNAVERTEQLRKLVLELLPDAVRPSSG